MGTPRAPWPLVWAVLQLGCWPGWLLEASSRPWSALTFSPARLVVPEGANATFTCSFSSKPEEHFVLNWYRMSPSNQTDKLAAFPEDRSQPGRDRRFRVTPLPGGQQFNMSIMAVQRNDSGVYFCGAIYLPPRTQINESHPAELTVTEGVLEPPTERPSPQPRPEGQMQSLVIGVTSFLLGVLLLLLLIWVLAAVFLGATRGGCACRSQDQLPKEGSPSVPAVTVDYGELDFQWREKAPEPAAPCVPEQTEYATIVFPGRRASADSPQGPWPLRTEDGHCSWPL
ncbi:programmed cell death protein 1 [Capricornis sumatraensis]|uniref:programmed cell death protein 1 n=1 Tax=Capricornis sumatraensis TaxID=34865 RepID=UPI003604CBF9